MEKWSKGKKQQKIYLLLEIVWKVGKGWLWTLKLISFQGFLFRKVYQRKKIPIKVLYQTDLKLIYSLFYEVLKSLKNMLLHWLYRKASIILESKFVVRLSTKKSRHFQCDYFHLLKNESKCLKQTLWRWRHLHRFDRLLGTY